MSKLSLRHRLLLFFLLIALLIWSAASGIAYWHTTSSINEMFDTQQLLFAKRLAKADLSELSVDEQHTAVLPNTRQLIPAGDRGHQDDDVLGFAIFNHLGELLLSDNEHGREFGYHVRNGFVNSLLESDDDDEWRILYITTPDKRYTIAVGQELNYRQDLVMDIIVGQLWPWLAALPIILLLMAWMLRYELRPLHRVADEVIHRNPDDNNPLQTPHIPQEARPLVEALNTLFIRIGQMLEHERQFTADAAHELRTPLTALRIQSEVAQLAENDDQVRHNALNNIISGIDRTSRLVDQLLALSRLEGNSAIMNETETVDLCRISELVVDELQGRAHEKNISLNIIQQENIRLVDGNEVLLRMLLSNLVSNALHYTPEHGEVLVILSRNKLQVVDNGPGVMPGYLARLGERFFRPPGMGASGSGLGLSIVRRIVQMHRFQVNWNNRAVGGFEVTVELVP
ncbi:two-component system sensor histidine kinase QseC [Salmonella enterica]|nr:two-component system sensor histidine kinase QseC [Salmonella enterica]